MNGLNSLQVEKVADGQVPQDLGLRANTRRSILPDPFCGRMPAARQVK